MRQSISQNTCHYHVSSTWTRLYVCHLLVNKGGVGGGWEVGRGSRWSVGLGGGGRGGEGREWKEMWCKSQMKWVHGGERSCLLI